MTMTLDSHQHRFGPLNLDHMASYPTSAASPQFSSPWGSSTNSPQNPSHNLYAVNNQGLTPNLSLGRQDTSRTSSNSNTSSLASFGGLPVTSAPPPSSLTTGGMGQRDLLNVPQDLLSIRNIPQTTTAPGYPGATYATATSPVHATYPASHAQYEGLGYAPAPMRNTFALAPEPEQSRRFSHPSVPSSSPLDMPKSAAAQAQRNPTIDVNYSGMQPDDRRSFADALDASHGMLAMSQETPRNIYGTRSDRSSQDSYGFPSTHSTSSSISSSGNFGPYIDDSVSDYSTTGSDFGSTTSRTLPRPSLMTSQVPPAPQSMMGQFSSKVSTGTQKKHKCKVCDKRFTRPSSLQTHMYSHTGEKPFACEVEGCGRHFSVVSNLRRHRKVHKGDSRSEAGSEEHHSD